MKKLMIAFAVMSVSLGAFAWCPRPHHHWHGAHYHHHYHGGWWGPGGCHFWPGFVGGVVGGAIGSAIVNRETVVVQPTTTVVTQPIMTQPVVVQQPVVTQPVVVQQPVVQQPVVVQQPTTVWVEGRYVDQMQANGSVVRVWQPGHYEQR